jgi:SNF2 family DNA or RNA helicase
MTVATPLKRKSLVKIKDEVEFYEHQIVGVRSLVKMTNFILADEMGLGKSLQALTVAAVDFERGLAERILVVCPSFLKWNWADEIDLMTNYTYTVLNGPPKKRREQLTAFDSDILIVNYEQLTNEADYATIQEIGFDIMIVDEAHYIKERKSQRHKAVIKCERKRIFLLTGSPMLNRPNELWAPLHAVDPRRFRSYWPFVNRYCVFGGFNSKQIVGAKNKAELRSTLAEYMVRRLKKDVLDLPDKQMILIPVDMHPEQKKIYEQMENDLQITIPGNPNPMQAENILTRYLRLKQIAGTPAAIGLADNSFKLDRAVQMCDEFTRDDDEPTPVVVWTQFRGVMEAMRQRLVVADIPVWTLHGDTPQPQRMKVIKEWEESDPKGVIIIMLQMGLGLNLTASDKAIFLDRLYVPKLNEQAEDRIHRIGASLTKPVQIFNLFGRGTVEEKIEKILKMKRKLFASLVEDETAWKRALIEELAREAANV